MGVRARDRLIEEKAAIAKLQEAVREKDKAKLTACLAGARCCCAREGYRV